LRYTSYMETVVHNIRDLNDQTRSAAEQLVGHELRENQQLRIQVSDVLAEEPSTKKLISEAPWSNIYDGLGDEKIDKLDEAIRQRANLTRAFE
jgi:hypothetical protein